MQGNVCNEYVGVDGSADTKDVSNGMFANMPILENLINSTNQPRPINIGDGIMGLSNKDAVSGPLLVEYLYK